MGTGTASKTHRARVAGIGVLAVLALTGCGGKSDGIDFEDGVGTGATSSSSATPSVDSTAAAEQAVLAGYAAYWKVTGEQALDPSSDRAAVTTSLQAVAVEPLLTTAVDDTVNAALTGQRGYGNYISRPKTTVFQDEDDTEAIVTDCIDSSQTGWEDAKTGRKLTVGVPAVHSEAKVSKGADGVWRVSDVTFNDNVTCTP